MTTTHTDIDDPTFRRRLADIVHEATYLADAVDRSVPCDWRKDQPNQCHRPAAWIAYLPCACPWLFCQPHRMVTAAIILGLLPDERIMCRCGTAFAPPVPVVWTEL